MNKTEDIKDATMKFFDHQVMGIPQEQYREVLEKTISELEARLDCVKEELSE